jgi:TPP-dependent 2-oxoacid decarboxylase
MVLLFIVIYTYRHFVFVFSLLKGRPVYIGLAVDLSDYEINFDPSSMKPLNLSIPQNPKHTHEAALETVIGLAKKAQNIVVIVDA